MADGKKYGGRQKGTPNKTTTMTKEVIAKLLSDYQETGLMHEDWLKLTPKDRMYVMTNLTNYVMPKMQAVAVDLNANEQQLAVSVKLKTLAEQE